MRVKNPKFSTPVAAFVASKKAAVNAFLQGLPADRQFATAEEIRAAFPADSDAMTDGTIAEILTSLGVGFE